MYRINKVMIGVVVVIAALAVTAFALHWRSIAVLNPQGIIASKERSLMIIATLLSLIVIVPVFVLTIGIAWKYRASNVKATYTPDWDHSARLETLWWGGPIVLIMILGVITWRSSHDLDPFRPIASTTPAMTIQVVALPWKWLFIYPQSGVATVNQLMIPVGRPVNFQITSDAPMNSFWIPQLGGQVYAMSGMSTQLHLMADHAGTYRGLSGNISGTGFAGMHFNVNAMAAGDYSVWLQNAKTSSQKLTMADYNNLAKPSQNNPVAVYASSAPYLYNDVIMKYMSPDGSDGMVMQ